MEIGKKYSFRVNASNGELSFYTGKIVEINSPTDSGTSNLVVKYRIITIIDKFNKKVFINEASICSAKEL